LIFIISDHNNSRANTAWEAAKTEKEGVVTEKDEMNTKIAELEHEIKILTSEADLFRGNMANILSTPEVTIDPTFEAIRDHFKSTHGQYVNRNRKSNLLKLSFNCTVEGGSIIVLILTLIKYKYCEFIATET